MIWIRFSGSADLGIRWARSAYIDPMTKHLPHFLKGTVKVCNIKKRELGINKLFSLFVLYNHWYTVPSAGTNNNAVNETKE
jgi:hypothetical protein